MPTRIRTQAHTRTAGSLERSACVLERLSMTVRFHACRQHVCAHVWCALLMCAQIRRFPYEKYPPHVMDVRNYAFKTLVIAEAMADHKAVLWIDSGLELRTDLHT